MVSFHNWQISIKEKGLRYKLIIIEALIIILPLIILSYLFHKNKFFFTPSQVVILALTLVLVLVGLIVLRQIFDRFFMIATLIKKAERGDEYLMDTQKDTSELHEISVSFKKLMQKFEDTNAELKQRVFELFTIKELIRLANQNLDIDDLLSILLGKVMAASRAKIGSVFMVEAENDRFRVVVSKGLESGPKKNSYIKIGESLAQIAVSDKKPLLVQDIETDLRTHLSNNPKYGPPSFLSIPVFVREKVIAVLNLAYKETKQAFDLNDEQVLSIMIDEIGVALERKQAEEKVKEYSKNLECRVAERTVELNRALSETEKAKDKIDCIIKSVADGLIVTDTYNRIILMNRAAEEILGVYFSESIDQPIDSAIKEERLREQIKAARDKKETGDQFDFELPGENTGYPRIIHIQTSIIHDKEGKKTGMVTIIHDATHEREVERMKTELVSTVAHELRTPLTSIQGFSELLLARDDIPEEKRKEYLTRINRSTANLAMTISDFLDISQIDSGKEFTLNRAKCSIKDIIRHTISHFQDTSPRHQIEVALPDEPVELFVDKEEMERVLKNLIDNAIRYSPEGGTVCLTAKVISDLNVTDKSKIRDQKSKMGSSAIEISVADTGIGMTPGQVKKIFDRFYRVDASDTAAEGSGLGMTIVKYIIEAHNGKVWVESIVGNGTVAKFVIPI